MKRTENNCFRYPCLLKRVFLGLLLLAAINVQGQTLAARSLQLVLPQGHSFGVLTMKFSPNGKWIATGSQDGTAKLWDVTTGKLLRTYSGHTGRVDDLNFTSDGKKIITTSWNSMGDATTKTWEVISGRLLYSINGFYNELHITSSLDKMFLSTGSDWELHARDMNSGKVLFTLKKEGKYFDLARICPDDLTVATASYDSIRIWSTKNGELLKSFVDGENITDMQFSPDGKLLITASEEGNIKVWSYREAKLLHDLHTGEGKVYKIRLAASSNKLISEKDSSVSIWDLATGNLIHKISHNGFMQADLSPDEKQMITSCTDHFARLWDITTGKAEDSIQLLSKYHGSVKFSPNGDKVFVSDGNHPKLWNVRKKVIHPVKNGESASTVFVFSPDGKWIATTYTILAEGENSAKVHIYDLATGKISKEIKGSANLIDNIISTPNGSGNLLSTRQGLTVFWNMQTLQIQHAFSGKLRYFVANTFSPDSRLLLTSNNNNKHDDKTPFLWSCQTGERLDSFGLRINDYAFPVFTADGKKVIFPVNNSIQVYDVKTGELLALLSEHTDKITRVGISSDGKYMGSASNDRTVRIWETTKFEPVAVLEGHSKYAYYIKFSPSGKFLCSADNEGVKVWEIPSGKLLHQFPAVKSGVFLNNETWLGTSTMTGKDDVIIWDLATGQPALNLAGDNPSYFEDDSRILFRDSVSRNYALYDILEKKKLYEVPSDGIREIALHPKNNRLLVSYLNTQVKWLDASSGKEILTYVSLDSTNYLALLPSGYYMASPGAARQVHYTNPKLDIVGFEQLDIKYNRPDKVLQAIGSTDTAQINSYKRAYLKRIKKLGVDTTVFSGSITIPEADFKNRNSIVPEQDKKEMQLQIKGTSTTELDRFNIWINEVPLYGQKGISLWNKFTSSIDTTLTVILSEGENHVETSVTDINGIESYRYPLVVNYKPGTPVVPKKYFLGIGINKFAEKGNELTWSVKDIRDLSKELSAKGFTIDTLFDKNVTKDKIKALKEKLLHSNEEDKIVVAYSGHGLLSRNYDYYLSTYPVNFKAPEEQGLLYEEMESLLDGIKARRKLLLIDACHSGEVDKEEMSRRMLVENSLKQKGTKGGKLTYVGENRVGMTNSFELMQELFVNIGRSTGATIISAAAGSQFALERGDLKNGVFTWCLLDAMKNKTNLNISVLKKVVIEKVPLLTNGLQKPTFRSETGQYDWNLW